MLRLPPAAGVVVGAVDSPSGCTFNLIVISESGGRSTLYSILNESSIRCRSGVSCGFQNLCKLDDDDEVSFMWSNIIWSSKKLMVNTFFILYGAGGS